MARSELPHVLRVEHEELHEEMLQATKLGGETGAAAREVVKVLFPHVLLEEEFGIPPLAILPRLARGEISPDMARVIPLAEMLKIQLTRMLDEHKLIVVALQKLLQAAQKEQQPSYARFAQKMIHHAQIEEEVLYPASIVVGEYVKWKLGKA